MIFFIITVTIIIVIIVMIKNKYLQFYKLKKKSAFISHNHKHVKAWFEPNLHKIRKKVITLPGFGIIFAQMAA